MLLRSEEASLSIIQSLTGGGGEEGGEAGWGGGESGRAGRETQCAGIHLIFPAVLRDAVL